MVVLTVLFLTLHILAMNVASVGPLVAMWLHATGRAGNTSSWEIGRSLARISLGCLLIGYVFGSLQLALSWAGFWVGTWHAVARVESRELGFIVVELAFSVACLMLYVAMWDRWRLRPWLHRTFAVLSSMNLLYHFPPLMSALGELAVRPDLANESTLTHAALRSIITRPEVLSLSVHFVVASSAVTGVLVMWLAGRRFSSERASDSDDLASSPQSSLIIAGAWLAFVASVLQLGIGAWVLVALPPRARNGLVGDDPLATTLFVASLFGAFGILHVLFGVVQGNVSRAAIRRSVLLMLAVVLLMTATLARSRHITESTMLTMVNERESLS